MPSGEPSNSGSCDRRRAGLERGDLCAGDGPPAGDQDAVVAHADPVSPDTSALQTGCGGVARAGGHRCSTVRSTSSATLVERAINKLKAHRAVATRYDERDY